MTDAQKVLKALIPAIDLIHGGCFVCAGDFIEDANKELERAGFPFRYEMDMEKKSEDRIQLKRVIDDD